MTTHLEIKTRTSLGWAPALGYLLTIAGGLALTAVGCHANATPDATESAVHGASTQLPPRTKGAGHAAELPSSLITQTTPASLPAAVAMAPSLPTAVTAPSGQTAAVAEKPASLEVKRFVVTSGIENREPLPTGETLEFGQPVFAFAELVAGKGSAARVEVVFEHGDGHKVGHAKLEVPADKPRWRTWAQSRHVNKPGQWSAVLLDGERNELARVKFEVGTVTPAVAAEALKGG